MKNHPNAKIGVPLSERRFSAAIISTGPEGKRSAAKAATMIVAEASYELTDPTIDSQIVRLKAAGGRSALRRLDTLNFAAQAIKKVCRPSAGSRSHILDINASPVLRPRSSPAGPRYISKDIISTNYGKDPGDPQWKGRCRHERPISPSWTNIILKATSKTRSTFTVIPPRNCWCISCSNAAGRHLTREKHS